VGLSREALLADVRRTINRQAFPPELYRFDEKREFSDSILAGCVWVTTLNTCRETEAKGRGDAKEGSMRYRSGTVRSERLTPDVKEIAQRSGIRLEGNVQGISLSNNTAERTMPEAMGDFGRFCIKLLDPFEFFVQWSVAVALNVKGLGTAMGSKVTYAEREYAGLEDPPGHPGFLKPPDAYAEQQEFRFMWLPRDVSKPLVPHLLAGVFDARLVERVRY
jgi:hypothetical protein